MLRLFLDEIPNNIEVIRDVERGFASLRLKCTDEEKHLVELIDKGTLIDNTSFIDRYGYKLYLSELSTGCKAALCVLNTDSIVDLVECGLNARDIIVSLCSKGSVLYNNNSATISNSYIDEGIKVRVGDFVFYSIDRLNEYLYDEYPYPPQKGKDVKYLEVTL